MVTTNPDDEWYEAVQTGEMLRQGQLLPNFRVQQATYRLVEASPEVETLPPLTVIIITQSCDLYRPERDATGAVAHNVLIAPLIPFGKEHVKNSDKFPRGKMAQHHFLPASAEFGLPYTLVSFALTTSVPYAVIVDHANANKCCRLKSPFLEDFSHRFGDLISRVALPEPAYDEAPYKAMVDTLKVPKAP